MSFDIGYQLFFCERGGSKRRRVSSITAIPSSEKNISGPKKNVFPLIVCTLCSASSIYVREDDKLLLKFEIAYLIYTMGTAPSYY